MGLLVSPVEASFLLSTEFSAGTGPSLCSCKRASWQSYINTRYEGWKGPLRRSFLRTGKHRRK
jgi:hypothetical protein